MAIRTAKRREESSTSLGAPVRPLGNGSRQGRVEDLERRHGSHADLVHDPVAVMIDVAADDLDGLDAEVKAERVLIEGAHGLELALATERPDDEVLVDTLDPGRIEGTIPVDDRPEIDALRDETNGPTRR